MGEKINYLRTSLGLEPEETVALSMFAKVKSHKRTSSTGKVFDVKAYVRALRQMSDEDLTKELDGADRMKRMQIVNEIRRRDLEDEANGD